MLPREVDGREANGWLPLAQRAVTLHFVKFPYPVDHEIPLFLAPMAGVSEAPFRQVCRGAGADVVVSEFLSAVGITMGRPQLLASLRFAAVERPIGIQLYGAQPEIMARAAALVTELAAPDFIDINFGCPVKKVVRNNGGSGCLKDPGLVEAIIRAVRGATDLPVSVKIRSGWDETQRDPVTIARRCRDAGAQALTLHPRTRTQMYSGRADWDEIGRVVEALDIPVVGSGDITTPEQIPAMRAHTRCAGVMIARGSFGNPWIFAQGRALLEGRVRPADPTPGERLATALAHARVTLELEGDTRHAAIEFRKHLAWYTKGLPGSADLRRRLFEITSLGQADALFAAYLEGAVLAAAA